MTESAVELEAVEKHYGTERALRGVTLSIERGARVLVTGPNGAGKSTLLRLLGGLTRPTHGAVRVLGQDAFGRTAASIRARLGYLGAEPGLYADLSVMENLRFAARLRSLPGDGIDPVVEGLDLGQVAQRRVRTLSLGFRKRAGLARALLGPPELLLLDEPWSGLDVVSAERLTNWLAGRLGPETTLLLAAHAVQDARALFDRELQIDSGRLQVGQVRCAGDGW